MTTQREKKARRKRTCLGCRAYHYDGRDHCSLHFKINQVPYIGPRTGMPIPASVCPKPRTYEQLAIEEEKKR